MFLTNTPLVVCWPMSRTTTKQLVASLAAALLVLTLGASVAGASASAIYQACRDGGSMSGFSKADLQGALGGVPSDLDDYYGCSAQINAAIIDKSVSKIPGAGKGVKGTRAKLRNASIEDLTTPAQRKRALAEATKSTPLDPADPLPADINSAIKPAAGKTLASTAAPGTPIALVLGLVGLFLLLALELISRMTGSSALAKVRPGKQPSDEH